MDGLRIEGGLVRAPGGGILIDGATPVLSNNVFTNNSTLTPANWAPKYLHETAHDGGAIYCRNGGAPVIRNNLITENGTEIGRGGGIAFDHGCDGVIANNAIISNVAGAAADPMRSSDGGGISIFNWSSPEITGNVVLGNWALHNNDGGGIFVAYWSSAKVRDNVIVTNLGSDDGGGLFVGGQEHRYDRPFDPMPSAEEFFVEVTGNRFFGNTDGSGNSSALRITMESRGRVEGNVAALNGGFYLQRSELEVVDNTILEDTLLIETKEGLEPTRFSNNIVTGSLESDGTATVTASLIRDGAEGDGNEAGLPELLDDGRELQVLATSWSPSTHQTRVTVAAPLPPGDLTNRVVTSHDDWGVIHSASGRHLTLWGSIRFATELSLLPTYRQLADSPGFGKGADAARAVSDYQPRRVNKSIELLERGQPIYYDASTGGYEEGMRMAGTWATTSSTTSSTWRSTSRRCASSCAAWSTPAPPRAATARRPSSSPCPCSASTKRPSPPAAGWSSRPSPRASTASTSPAPATRKESSASSRPPATRSTSRPPTPWASASAAGAATPTPPGSGG